MQARPIKRIFAWAVLSSTLVAFAPAEEPALRFMDDLLGNGRQRDPYEERIETDRHDFTQSTKTVGRGVVQLESGYTYFYKDEGEEIEHAHTGPELLMRVGLSDDIEFRLRYNYAWINGEEGPIRSGAEDLRWGLKFRTTDQSGFLPESAVELRSTAPTGGDDFSTGQVEFGVDTIYGWRMGERTELYGSTGFATNGLAEFGILADSPSDDRFMLYSQSVALGYEFSESTAIYSEFFGLFTSGHVDDPNPIFFNIGLDRYLSHSSIIDFRIGKGLNGDSDDLFAGIGGAIRF